MRTFRLTLLLQAVLVLASLPMVGKDMIHATDESALSSNYDKVSANEVIPEDDMCGTLNPGSIGGGDDICSGTNLPAFTNVAVATVSGCTPKPGQVITYLWQYRAPGGTWYDLAGETSTTYDPASITTTTEFRRKASFVGQVQYSNVITVAVDAPAPGSIGGSGQDICHGATPSTLTNEGSASGGDGNYTYEWQYRLPGANWNAISSTDVEAYTPGSLNRTTEYRRKVTICSQPYYSNTITVTVKDALLPGLIGGTGQTLCYGETAATLTNSQSASGGGGPITYQWESKPVGSGSWASIGGANSTSYSPGALTSSTEYRRKVSTTCNIEFSDVIAITVNPPLSEGSISNTNTQLCYNEDAVAFGGAAASGGDGSYTYEWQKRVGGGSWDPIGSSNVAFYNPGNLTVTTDFRRKVSSCNEDKFSNTITINVYGQLQAGALTAIPAALCNGDLLTNISSQSPAAGGDGNPSYFWQYRKAGTSDSWDQVPHAYSEAFTQGIALTESKEFRRGVTSCNDTTYTTPITVTVNPVLNKGSVAGTQIICHNSAPQGLTNVAASGGDGSYQYQWQSRPPGGSWDDISGATSQSYNPGIMTTTTEFRREVTSCGDTQWTDGFTVTVRPALQTGSISNAVTTLCYNEDAAAFTSTLAAGGDGSYEYEWEKKESGGNWETIANTNSATYDPGNLTISTEYRRKVTSCSEELYSNVIAITVHPQLQAGALDNISTVFCYGDLITNISSSSAAVGGDGNPIYFWQYRLAGSSNTWEQVNHASSETMNQGVALLESKEFRRGVTSCNDTTYTTPITVAVHPQLNEGSISGDDTICYNQTPTAFTNVAAAGGDGSYDYQWQSRPPGGSWDDIIGATNQAYTPGAMTATTEFRREVTSCNATEFTNVITVTVRPELVAGTISNAVTQLCYDEDATAFTSTVASGGDGSYIYEWQEKVGAGNWEPISGANAATYDPGNLTVTTQFRRKVSSCLEDKFTTPITLNVYGELQAGEIGGAQTICYGAVVGTLTDDVSIAGGDGNPTFFWEYRLAGSSNTWDPVSHANDAIMDENLVLFESKEFRRGVTSCNVTKYTTPIVVTVTPALQAGSISADQTICYNDTPTITATSAAGGYGGYTYQWYKKEAGDADFSEMTGEVNQNITVGAHTVNTEYKRLDSSCNQSFETNTILVNVRLPLVGGTITSDQDICYDTTPAQIQSSIPVVGNHLGGDGNYQYEWQISTDNVNWTPLGSTDVENYTHTTSLTQDRYFRRKVSSCGAEAFSNVVTITVKQPIQDFEFVSTQAAFCSDEQATVTLESSQTGVVYQLKLDGSNSGGTVTGDGNPIVWNVSQAGTYTVDANQVNCTVESLSASIGIFIDQKPTVYDVIGGGDVCHNELASVSLVDSDLDMEYYLSRNGVVKLSSKKVGSGDTLKWESLYQSGLYNVVARTPGCGDVPMNNLSTTVSILSKQGPPVVSDTVVYSGTGVTVSVQNPDPNALYYWYVADTLVRAANNFIVPAFTESLDLKVQASVNGCLSDFSEMRVYLSDVYPPTAPTQVTACGEQYLQMTDTLPADIEWYWQGTNANGYKKGHSASKFDYRLLKDGTYYVRAYDKVQKIWGPETTSVIVDLADPNRSIPIACDDVTAMHIEATPGAYVTGSYINSIRSYDALRPGMDEDSILNETNPNFVRQAAQYIDGLGRPLQTVQKGATPDTTDMVQMMHYDALGRQAFNYLPYASTESNGAIKADPFAAQKIFYAGNDSTITAHFPDEDVFYSRTLFEESPLNRTEKSMAPGDAWAGSMVGVESLYNSNSLADSVIIWKLDSLTDYPLADTIYDAGELSASETIDEQGNHVQTFTDKLGQVLLKRVQDEDSPEAGHGDWLNTYYVYDVYNQLRYVLPPRAVEVLDSVSWAWNVTDMDELTFQYRYDDRGRMITKKVPGAGEVHMVYDNLDRLVLTQDANQRANDVWTFTKYDQLNRPAMTGFYNYSDQDTTSSDRLALQDSLDTWTKHLFVTSEAFNSSGIVEGHNLIVARHMPNTTLYRAAEDITFLPGFNGTGEFETELNDNLNSNQTYYKGYYDATFPMMKLGNVEVITVNYYDDYHFTDKSFDTADPGFYLESSAEGQATNAVKPELTPSTRGLATGSSVKILGSEDSWLTTAMFYDEKGRVIQTNADNHAGGYDLSSSQYDFSGKLLHMYSVHKNPKANADSVTTIFKRFEYDHMGRLLTVKDELNDSGTFKTVASNSYNALGELESKVLGEDIETLDYDYNIRGWLTGINKAFVADSTLTNYFGMTLSYEGGYENNYRNGNIAGIQWRSHSFDEAMSYGFAYDKSNRLTKAEYGQGASSWANNLVDFSVSNLEYDANGNIKSLKRMGMVDDNAEAIDDLSYVYANGGRSNQLISVSDVEGDAGQGDFVDGNTSGSDYSYDLNGNMVMDKNKGINSAGDIEYNHLNLPIKVTFDGSSSKTIEYTYDAAGIKLSKKVTDGSAVKTTDYIGGFIYQDNELQHFAHEEGRVRKRGSDLVYDFFVKDHLGNTRMTLTEDADTVIYLATMETDVTPAPESLNLETFEENLFLNLDAVRDQTVAAANSTNITGITNNETARLNGSVAGRQVGPAKMLIVAYGDLIELEVKAYHQGNYTDQGSDSQAALASALITAFGGVNGGSLEQQLHFDAFNNNPANALVGIDGDANSPRSYLNYVLFNEELEVKDLGFMQVSDTANVHQTLTLSTVANTSGYLYVYVSNESLDNHNVYFDDLRITHSKNVMVQEDHYYPFGMNIQALSSTAPLSKPNRYKYNGNEEQLDFDWNIYDFNARLYDAQIGRFGAVDPLAELRHQSNWNPYHFSYNNPINLSDPTGLDALGLDWSWMDDGGAQTYNAAEAYGNSVRGRGGNGDQGNSSEQQGFTSGGCPPATICPGKDGKVNLDVAENVTGNELTDNGSDPENNTTDPITINLKKLKNNMGTGAFSYGFTVMGNIREHGSGVSLGAFYGKGGKGIFITVFEPEEGAMLSGSFDMTIYSPVEPGRDVLLGDLKGEGFQVDAGVSYFGYSRGTNAHSDNYPDNFQMSYRSHSFSISTGLDVGYSQSKSRTMVFPVIPYIPILLTTFKGIR